MFAAGAIILMGIITRGGALPGAVHDRRQRDQRPGRHAAPGGAGAAAVRHDLRPVDDRRGGDDVNRRLAAGSPGLRPAGGHHPAPAARRGALGVGVFPGNTGTPPCAVRDGHVHRRRGPPCRGGLVTRGPFRWLSVVCGVVALLTLASYMVMQDAAPLDRARHWRGGALDRVSDRALGHRVRGLPRRNGGGGPRDNGRMTTRRQIAREDRYYARDLRPLHPAGRPGAHRRRGCRHRRSLGRVPVGFGHDKRLDPFIASMERRYGRLRGLNATPPFEFDVVRSHVFIGIPWIGVEEVVTAVGEAAFEAASRSRSAARRGRPACPARRGPITADGTEADVHRAETAFAAIGQGTASSEPGDAGEGFGTAPVEPGDADGSAESESEPEAESEPEPSPKPSPSPSPSPMRCARPRSRRCSRSASRSRRSSRRSSRRTRGGCPPASRLRS